MSGSLWLDSRPLILASASAARFGLLVSAGIPVEKRPANIDERAAEAALSAGSATPAGVAMALAAEKARAVSRQHPGRLVLGADQTLSCEGRRFSKPASPGAAREQLLALSGRMHALISAQALARDGVVIWTDAGTAQITMRTLSTDMLDRYLSAAGDKVMTSVGAYQLEGLGIHLMQDVQGDHATILGLPLLPLFRQLRELGVLSG
jgi:septum formation protein